MPETIDSLLVKLGLDNDKKSFDEGMNLFNLVKSKALLFGAAIGATVGVLGKMTHSFADSKNQLGKFADVLSVSPQLVDGLGHALKKSGGQAENAFGSIQKVADLIEKTEWGEVPEDAFKIVGLDPYLLRGVTGIAEAYERLADATKGFSKEDRRRFFKSLGFDQAEITLFAGGADKMKAYFAEAEKMAPVTGEMIENATEFMDALIDMKKAVKGITDQISNELAPGMTLFFESMTGFITDNRQKIADKISSTIKNAPDFIRSVAVPGSVSKSLAENLGRPAFEFGQKLGQSDALSIDSLNYLADSIALKLIPKERLPQGVLDRMDDREGGYFDYLDRAEFSTSKSEQITVEQNITVDARGSTNPQEVERAAERGVQKAVNKMAENTINDIRSNLK